MGILLVCAFALIFDPFALLAIFALFALLLSFPFSPFSYALISKGANHFEKIG